jgi:malate dehydrogenase (oxaloacetate-decarboxylating)
LRPPWSLTPSASYSLTIRAAIKNRPGMLGRLTSAIGEAGGDIRAVDLVELVKDIIVRDFTINARDEQHGQAIVAAIRQVDGIRVVSVSDRTFLIHLVSVVVCGVGAAGTATIRILRSVGALRILGVDEHGILAPCRPEPMDAVKSRVAEETNPENRRGSLRNAVQGADVFIGLSVPGVLRAEDVKAMAKDPIVFAMANPVPEIMPEEAASHVRVITTGRSDYPNQINNVLCFPGFFRGLLDCRATRVTDEMKVAAGQAIASVVSRKELHEEYVIPSVFNKKVAPAVAREVQRAAQRGGFARRRRRPAH